MSDLSRFKRHEDLPKVDEPGSGFSGSPRQSFAGTAVILSPEDYHLLIDENARLTAALHKLEAHPDYEYDRGRENWERNPEAETPGGDECWRRRK